MSNLHFICIILWIHFKIRERNKCDLGDPLKGRNYFLSQLSQLDTDCILPNPIEYGSNGCAKFIAMGISNSDVFIILTWLGVTQGFDFWFFIFP